MQANTAYISIITSNHNIFASFLSLEIFADIR